MTTCENREGIKRAQQVVQRAREQGDTDRLIMTFDNLLALCAADDEFSLRDVAEIYVLPEFRSSRTDPNESE